MAILSDNNDYLNLSALNTCPLQPPPPVLPASDSIGKGNQTKHRICLFPFPIYTFWIGFILKGFSRNGSLQCFGLLDCGCLRQCANISIKIQSDANSSIHQKLEPEIIIWQRHHSSRQTIALWLTLSALRRTTRHIVGPHSHLYNSA